MINDDVSIEKSVNAFRSLVLFANKRTGSVTTIKWFHNTHKNYINYYKMTKAIEKLGYKINNNSELYNLLTEDGMFYDVIEKFNKDKDIEKLNLAIKTILSYRPTQRIIIEELPAEAISIISEYANEFHTSILFLTRKNRLQRLLSLWCAEKTGVSTFEDSINFNYKKFKIPELDIAYLIKKENDIIYKNKKTWEILENHKPRYLHLYYEDIFKDQTGTMDTYAILYIAFNWLFYRVDDFTTLVENGYFNLNKYYSKIPNVEKLEEKLKDIEIPKFSNIHIDA